MTNSEKKSRREFIKLSAKSAFIASMPFVLNDAKSGGIGSATRQLNDKKNLQQTDFELTSSLYAWEVHDEGIEQILDNLSIAGINSVYLITPMHPERRPFIEGIPEGRQTYFFPHNPVRKEWMAEDARVYFFPDMSMYGAIKPQKSDHAWLSDTDWLNVVIKAARARGMRVGAEVSHNYIPKSVLDRNPEWKQVNLDGKIRDVPCISHPDVKEYLLALYADLTKNYDIDYIMTCMLIFFGDGTTANSSCICQSCQNKAKKAGFDLTTAIPILRDNARAYPEVEQFQKFREDTTTEMYQAVIDRMHKEKPNVGFRLNDLNNWNTGLNLTRLKSHIASVHMSTHQEQGGKPNTQRISRIRSVRHYIGPDIPILASVTTRLLSTPDMIVNMIKTSVEMGVQGIGIKHYDGTPFSRLRAVRNGLHEAGVKGFLPVLGIEAEQDMSITGFSKDAFLTENCIRLTDAKGTAWASFKYETGTYDVAITYTDEKLIQGSLELLVGGKQVAKWELTENVDCWRRKIIPDVNIRNGEEIRIIGTADNLKGDNTIRIDFVEFSPKTI